MTIVPSFQRPLLPLVAALVSMLIAWTAWGQVDLSDQTKWSLHVSHEAVKASLTPPSNGGAGFEMAYNFTAGSGFTIARCEFPTPIDLPENYELSFTLSGSGPSNDLEVKLLDAPDGKGGKLGDSVWWVKRRNYEWPTEPTRVNNKAKHFQFAWGPLNGAKIKKLEALEIVVASSTGGQGTIRVTDIHFRPLPAPSRYTGTPTATSDAGDHAEFAVDNDPSTAWHTLASEDSLVVDFGSQRDLDALRIDWATPFDSFEVFGSDDGAHWQSFWTARTPGFNVIRTKRSYVDIPDTTARYLRLVIKGTKKGIGISEIRVLTRPAGEETLGVWPLIAADFPPEAMPRYFTGRQSTWTVLGSPNSDEEALINEEGDVEPFHSGPMVSAMVLAQAVDHSISLEHWDTAMQRMDLDGAPMAVIERKNSHLTLTTRAFGSQSETLVLYTLVANNELVSGSLALCIRPFQVDPPWQFLNIPGGLARVRSIEPTDHGLVINGKDVVAMPGSPTYHLFAAFDQGEAGVTVATAGMADGWGSAITDDHGAASSALLYAFSLKPGEQKSWLVHAGHAADMKALNGDSTDGATEFEQIRAEQRPAWAALDKVKLNLPPGNEQLAASIKASLAYILINKDGPGFQPGSRSYERSWMRDGALTSAALLEFGLGDEVKKFIDWYATYQFPDGGIPCVVDKHGADPVVENDSHGEFIYALAEYHRFTHDDAFLLKHFGAVEKAVAHIEAERAKRRTAEYLGEGSRAEAGKPAVPLKAFYGLMPESISHEGYSSKPMHSYWDDFFTLKGLRDAVEIAGSLRARALADGQNDVAEQFTRREAEWKEAADHFAKALRSSIESVRAAHGIDYIPGCVELGDFDATSTTIAINPCGVLNDLPREWFEATFERWWNFFAARRDGRIDYVDYTPYEWRIVGSLVMMGQRERAWLATKWYMQDQNPVRQAGDTSASGWLHWAEIVHKDRGVGKWIGDMPHTWVASDFLRSIRTMFVYEEPSPSPTKSNLVLFAGVPAEWADAPGGVSFTGLRTPYGPLNASLKKQDGWYVLHYDGLDAKRFPYRVRLAPPVAWPPSEFEVTEGGGSQDTVGGSVNGITTGMTIRFR